MERRDTPVWKAKIEEKIPDKIMIGLQKAFSKAFYLIFEKDPPLLKRPTAESLSRKIFRLGTMRLK